VPSLLWRVPLDAVPSLLPLVGALALSGAVFGAASGAALGWSLERLRGRVPLPLLALLAAIVAGLAGQLAGAAAVAPLGVPIVGLAAWSATFHFLVGGLVWLPYTVASVLRRPTWPVLVGASLVALPLSEAIRAVALLLLAA
jgi:hypothetical protein